MPQLYPALPTDPDHVDREISKEDMTDLQYVVQNYFHDNLDTLLAHRVCLYANSPDENFIIDTIPGYEDNVIVACGFSGHGFKFASVIGEILADLAEKGSATLPIEFLKANRF